MKKHLLLLGLALMILLGGCASQENDSELTPEPGVIPAPLETVEDVPGQPAGSTIAPEPESGYPAPVLTLPAASYPEPPAPQTPSDPYPDNTVWVIHPMGQQCREPLYPDERAATRALAESGVTVLSAGTVDLIVCQACDCPTSTHFRVLIDEEELSVVEGMGWETE